MARDRNEMGGSLGGQPAGQGERTAREARGARAERDRAREGKLSATAPETRRAARGPDRDETPRRPKRDTMNRAGGRSRAGKAAANSGAARAVQDGSRPGEGGSAPAKAFRKG